MKSIKVMLALLFVSSLALAQNANIDSLKKKERVARVEQEAKKQEAEAYKLERKVAKLEAKMKKAQGKVNAAQAKSDISMALLKKAVADKQAGILTDEAKYQEVLNKANKESLHVNDVGDKVFKMKVKIDKTRAKALAKQEKAAKKKEKAAALSAK